MKQILIALDQLANTLIGGKADETISARAWRERNRYPWKLARAVLDGLFFWERGHCLMSYVSEMERRQLPREYQECR